MLAARMRAHADDVLGSADVVVPVPLHRSRLRSRGFNQAGEIAEHLGVPVRRALRRRRATPSQTDLPAGQRHRSVRGAFAITRGADVRGLRVALVDAVVGFDVTPQMAAFNRVGKRFRVNAGASAVAAAGNATQRR